MTDDTSAPRSIDSLCVIIDHALDEHILPEGPVLDLRPRSRSLGSTAGDCATLRAGSAPSHDRRRRAGRLTGPCGATPHTRGRP